MTYPSQPNSSLPLLPPQSDPLLPITLGASLSSDHPEVAIHEQHARPNHMKPERVTDDLIAIAKGAPNTHHTTSNHPKPSCHPAVEHGDNGDNDQQKPIRSKSTVSTKSKRSSLAKSILKFFQNNPKDCNEDATSPRSSKLVTSSSIQSVGTVTIAAAATATLSSLITTESTTPSVDMLSIGMPYHIHGYALPPPYSRIDDTLLLAYCCSVLSKWEMLSGPALITKSPYESVSLNEKEKEWAKNIDSDEQSHLPRTCQQVSLNICRRFYQDELKDSTLLNLSLLQGLVQLVECASHRYLVDNSPVGVTLTLSERLAIVHNGPSDHHLYLMWALSRILDVL
ncbi:hypothetical protein FBU30_001512, partial [Linnemannia zychae]